MSESKLLNFFFASPKMSWLWLLVRLYLGYEWFMAGWEKIGNSAWIGDERGIALSGFVNGALAKTTGAHPAVLPWYGWFLENVVLPNASVWSYFIVFGELMVGLGLIVGLFTATATFFGGFMNLNFMLSGSAGINPVMFVVAVLLLGARRISGLIGIDGLIRRRRRK